MASASGFDALSLTGTVAPVASRCNCVRGTTTDVAIGRGGPPGWKMMSSSGTIGSLLSVPVLVPLDITWALAETASPGGADRAAFIWANCSFNACIRAVPVCIAGAGSEFSEISLDCWPTVLLSLRNLTSGRRVQRVEALPHARVRPHAGVPPIHRRRPVRPGHPLRRRHVRRL